MRYKLSTLALIGTLVLLLTSCSTTRNLKSEREVSSFRFQESRDTIREQVVVAIHDTVMVTKTITIMKNEVGDTTFTSIVTDRDRTRDRVAVRDAREKSVTRVDTVYIERRDSTSVSSFRFQDSGGEDKSTWGGRFRSTLKWIFWILLAATVLIVILRLGRKGIL